MHLTRADITDLDKVKRLNLINAVSGIKPANLIGTISDDGHLNVAIFSSVVHLGSNPALFGFVVRPTGEVPRNTYENIIQNGYYTINSVPRHIIKKAHYTSAKFEKETSEFERCKLTPEFIDDFKAPFVAESPVKIGLQMEEEISIQLNGTKLIIGSVAHLIIPDELVAENGYVNLPGGDLVGIGGLNTYYGFEEIDQFPYVRLAEVPDFE